MEDVKKEEYIDYHFLEDSVMGLEDLSLKHLEYRVSQISLDFFRCEVRDMEDEGECKEEAEVVPKLEEGEEMELESGSMGSEEDEDMQL